MLNYLEIQMDVTPNWMKRECYKASMLKADLLSMALSLYHAWSTLKDQYRELELAHIEARATIKAYADKIDEDAKVMRKLVAKANRADRSVHEEFTFAQLRDASARYCDLHGCRSVDMETLKTAMRNGHV